MHCTATCGRGQSAMVGSVQTIHPPPNDRPMHAIVAPEGVRMPDPEA